MNLSYSSAQKWFSQIEMKRGNNFNMTKHYLQCGVRGVVFYVPSHSDDASETFMCMVPLN